jgi:sugar/nucleoside kinase (ribokinase family)
MLQNKIYDVCGLGNALVDILIQVSNAELEELGYEKSRAALLEAKEQQALLSKLDKQDKFLASGGSVANSIIALSQLGGKAAFIGCVGDDKYGLFYQSEFEDLRIETAVPLVVGGTTGTCVCLITPDSERTMCTSLGVSSNLSDAYISEEVIALSKWLFIEGYLFANPENGQKAISRAIEVAKKNSCKIAITFSDTWILDLFGDAVREAVAQADLVFANVSEVCSFAKLSSRDEAFTVLSKVAKSVVMTAGEEGAYVSLLGKNFHVPAYKCDTVDLTGAGDMFAGSFLYGITNNIDPQKTSQAACYLASKVISRIGARLHTGTKDYWNEIVLAGT